MTYYVKQSDPNNGLLSCPHTCTHKERERERDPRQPVCNQTLDRLRSSNHIYNVLRRGVEGEWRKDKLGQELTEEECVGVRVEVVLLF